MRNLVPEPSDPKKRKVEALVFYDLASGVRVSFLQYPMGVIDQPYSFWKNTCGHKYPEAKITVAHLRGWLSQKHFAYRENGITWFRYFKAIFILKKWMWNICYFRSQAFYSLPYLFLNIYAWVCRYNL